jgi:hypothetical protein
MTPSKEPGGNLQWLIDTCLGLEVGAHQDVTPCGGAYRMHRWKDCWWALWHQPEHADNLGVILRNAAEVALMVRGKKIEGLTYISSGTI